MFFINTFNASKVILCTFYLNGKLHVVSVRTDVKFLDSWFVKTESEPNFGFLHIHSGHTICCLSVSVQLWISYQQSN